MQLELASVLIIAIIALGMGMMLVSKYNSVTILCVGLVSCYLVSYLGTSNMYVVWNELGFKTALIGDITEYYTLITSSFLHKDLTHLFSNMIFLIMIGYPMKRRISNGMFLVFIIFGDVFGTVFYALSVQDMPQIVIGASIFVSSIVGAMIVMYPRLEVVLPRPIGDTKLEIWMVCAIWILMQILQVTGTVGGAENVAYLGHVYGFAIGFLIGIVSKSNRFGWSILRSEDTHIDVTKLEYLCVTDQHKAYYEKAMSNDDPDFRDAWARYLIQYIPCPKCGGEFRIVRSSFVCPNGHIIAEGDKTTIRKSEDRKEKKTENVSE